MAETPASQRGVYGISVAAELSGISPQTLRLYERRGLVAPSRTDGGTRRYSEDDLRQLQRVAELVEAGVNLVGVAHIVELEQHNVRLRRSNDELTSDNSQLESDNARLRAERGD
ncbi:helix-turn-helix transcriptional regulator [Rhodococcus sp. X156]|uniref:MerR family transcriptional regulator n=1 Tax=Rhodococcus sp. X156 TaxID=2499145 RepID=UPI000FD96B6A|nr:helix-turn-helix transcriptional regulator [Rhodococcus sp. X156]